MKQNLALFFSNYGFDDSGQIEDQRKQEVRKLVSQVTNKLAQSGMLQIGPDGVPISGSLTTIFHDHPPIRRAQRQPSGTAPAKQFSGPQELPALTFHAEFPSEPSPDGAGPNHRESKGNKPQDLPTTIAEGAQYQSRPTTISPPPPGTETPESSYYPPRASSVSPFASGATVLPTFDVSIGSIPSHIPFESTPTSMVWIPEQELSSSEEVVTPAGNDGAGLDGDTDHTLRMPATATLGDGRDVQTPNDLSCGDSQGDGISDTSLIGSFRTAHEDEDGDDDDIAR